MGDLSALFPIENWLKSQVHDVELIGPIAKARAEFAGWTEPEVRAAWDQCEAILRAWMKASGHPTPTYQPRHHIVRAPDGTPTLKASPAPPEVDFVKAVKLAIRQKAPPLLKYLRWLDRTRSLANAKLAALVVLHEAAAGQPERAVEASWLHDLVIARLRPLIDDGIGVRDARRAGGRATAQQKTRKVEAAHAAVATAAQAMLQAGYSRRELASTLQDRFPTMSLRTIRRILQHAGL
jgi:hypothetical protein